jgi:hypothetical protein
MATKEFTLKSGAKLVVTAAPMQDCDALMSALAKCSKGIPLTDDILRQDITHLKDYFAEAISSPDFKSAIWKCAQRSTYENVRVSQDLFDDPKLEQQARGDYFEILFKIIEVNCAPFFAQIFSLFKTRQPSADATPKQP